MASFAPSSTAAVAPRKRLAYAAAFAVLLAAALVAGGPLDPLLWAAFIAPDLALLTSPQVLRTGILDRRAVRTYNLAHDPRPAGALALAGLVVPVLLVPGLAWFAHIAMDRAAGYGPRAADGSQRGY